MTSPVIDCAKPDPDRHFRTDHLMADLKGRSVRGGAITLAAQAAKFVLRMGSTVVLARLLTPADYGLVAMVAAVVGVAVVLRDLGLSTATIQKATISQAQLTNLFWVNLLVGLLLTLIVAACGPVIAWLYGDWRITSITLLLAPSFVLAGLGVQHRALLARQMRVATRSAIELLSLSTGIACGIVLAAADWGYWSLVAMALSTELSDMVFTWVACRWRPGLPSRSGNIFEMLRFGGGVSIATFINYVARNVDNVLIGWYWGPLTLGIYNRAYQLFMLPLQQVSAPLNAVVFPALSRLQSDAKHYRRYYLRVLAIICFVGMPMAAMFVVLAPEMVQLCLGRNWGEVVPVFQVLGIAALFQPVTNTTGWLYLTLRRTKELVVWTAIWTTIVVVSFVVGLPFGAVGVAAAYAVARSILIVPSVYFATRGTAVTTGDVVRTILRPLVTAGVVAMGCLVVKLGVWPDRPVFMLTAGAVLTVAITMGAMAIDAGDRAVLTVVWRELRRRSRSAKAEAGVAVAAQHGL